MSKSNAIILFISYESLKQSKRMEMESWVITSLILKLSVLLTAAPTGKKKRAVFTLYG